MAAAEKAAKKMKRAEVRRYEMGHFDIYQGEDREKSLADQLGFLEGQVGWYQRGVARRSQFRG